MDKQGEPGIQGIRGRRGAMLPKRIVGSFVALAAIFFVIVFLFSYAVVESRNASNQAKSLAVQARELSLQNKNLVRENRARIKENSKAITALCIIRRDRKQQIRSTKSQIKRTDEFLKEHPNGVSGISRTDIVNSQQALIRDLSDQKKTKKALGILNCSNQGEGK